MLRDIYVRPVGLFPACNTETTDEVWGGLRLAAGWLDFAAIEVLERNGSRLERRIGGIGEILERDWGRRSLNASDMFDALLAARARLAGLSLERPRIMGIVNVTPDSFSDGGVHNSTEAAIQHGLQLVADGADILDIGGESTRPGSDAISVDEELRRVIPVIEALADQTEARISIDTRKARVMRAASRAGADIINDVSALTYDPDALTAVADLGMPVILMHAQGDPKTMQATPHYEHVLVDVFDYLEARVEACQRAGIPVDKIVVDPGIGFGKTLEHNLALLAGLAIFHGTGCPILVGASRKGMIGLLTGVNDARQRVSGSVGAALAAVAQGAQLIRVHDVAQTREALDVWMASTRGVVES